jgi:hypothetical protein
MVPKHLAVEALRIERGIAAKKDRISKLGRLAKLSKNADLISEYDSIIKQCESTINYILESKELMDPVKEQVVLHSEAKVKLMAKGLRDSLCESDKQIDIINQSVVDDNIRLEVLQKNKSGGTQIC